MAWAWDAYSIGGVLVTDHHCSSLPVHKCPSRSRSQHELSLLFCVTWMVNKICHPGELVIYHLPLETRSHSSASCFLSPTVRQRLWPVEPLTVGEANVNWVKHHHNTIQHWGRIKYMGIWLRTADVNTPNILLTPDLSRCSAYPGITLRFRSLKQHNYSDH